jgi:CheY-like chemotaxis protein
MNELTREVRRLAALELINATEDALLLDASAPATAKAAAAVMPPAHSARKCVSRPIIPVTRRRFDLSVRKRTDKCVFSREAVISCWIGGAYSAYVGSMSTGESVARILVVDDVEEVLDALEKLLESDGYSVDAARTEDRALECAQRNPPDLILLNLGDPPDELVATARRLKARARLADDVPVVLFCIESVAEGAEVDLGNSMYATRPDNFNQLRALIARLLEARTARPDATPGHDPAGGRTRS